MMDLKLVIRKWVLHNAIHYEGKANQGAVIGKILSEHQELKQDIKSLAKEVGIVIKEISKLSMEEQTKELQKIAPELLEEQKKEEKKLKDLPNAENGKVVMRIAPSPSGPIHIGHAIVTALNNEYVKMYKGKFILRIEDTNPENIYEPAYKMIEEDIQWLTNNNVKEVIIQSDRLGKYYDYAEQLIAKGNAYICTCDQEKFKELLQQKKPCSCRNLDPKIQHERWDNMFSSYKPGEAVMRIKTDIEHPNPAMRDWPAFRINDHPHPKTRTEQRVWPLMNFSVAVDDHELGITHTIRGKDHMDNEKRQKYLFDYLGWKTPTHLYIGRINFIGLELSKTKTKEKIARGEYAGWDDIRLATIKSLRRRGYQAEAFTNYALDMGVTQTDKTVSQDEFFKALDKHNKEILDLKTNRYFFIYDSVEIKINNAPEQEIKLKLHPEDPKRGFRDFKTGTEFYITKQDFEKLKTRKVYRLMDCMNFVKKKNKLEYHSKEYEQYKEKGEMILHWLPVSKDLVNVEIMMPDATIIKGLAEPLVKNLKVNDIIQFERFGFVRLDQKEKDKLTFWFTNR